MKYTKVIPRDLFNDGKLLKCMGRLCLLIEDNMAPGLTYTFYNEETFRVVLSKEGSLNISNIWVSIYGHGHRFKTTYNSLQNYPLIVDGYANNHSSEEGYEEITVFGEKGEFSEEFKKYCLTVKNLKPKK